MFQVLLEESDRWINDLTYELSKLYLFSNFVEKPKASDRNKLKIKDVNAKRGNQYK